MPAGFFAGTSLEPMEQAKAPVDERGCRRDIRSSGRTASSRKAQASPGRSGRRNEFSSFGADPSRQRRGRSFTGTPSGSKFGPDVFADALVPSEPDDSCRHSLIHPTSISQDRRQACRRHQRRGVVSTSTELGYLLGSLPDRSRDAWKPRGSLPRRLARHVLRARSCAPRPAMVIAGRTGTVNRTSRTGTNP